MQSGISRLCARVHAVPYVMRLHALAWCVYVSMCCTLAHTPYLASMTCMRMPYRWHIPFSFFAPSQIVCSPRKAWTLHASCMKQLFCICVSLPACSLLRGSSHFLSKQLPCHALRFLLQRPFSKNMRRPPYRPQCTTVAAGSGTVCSGGKFRTRR